MLEHVHEEMTRSALEERLSPRALEIIIAANVRQDSWRNLIGHNEYHYDNNAIEDSNRYIREQRGHLLAALLSPGLLSAWIAFGRLTHTAQDFYSHTNYVSLWLASFDGAPPPASEIDPLERELVNSPELRSGRIYLPLDALYFVPFLRRLTLRFLPADSHGRMNLDSPREGRRFEYARAAAVKRTRYEFELLEKLLTPEMFARFIDR